MLARGIHSYHRPTRLEEALTLARQGAIPLAGGTRLLATPAEIPNVLDLSALGLSRIRLEEEDLCFGATASLQQIVDAPDAWRTTAGLLPTAALAQQSSRMIRGMATVGGESIHGDPDSELIAALLALNAIYVVANSGEPRESPALRFLKKPADDLFGGGILTTVMIPGAPDGAALERVAPLASAPSLVAAAVAITLAGGHCVRVRIAVTGLEVRPSRILEAEAVVERTAAAEQVLEQAADQVAARAPFRDDARASAAWRRLAGRAVTLRALRRALERAQLRAPVHPPRARPPLPQRATPGLAYFTSGRIEITVDGRPLRAEVDAGTTLLQVLRREGLRGAKEGCQAGECGTCTVLLDGRPVNACLTLALRAQGRSVVTVEGLGGSSPHPLQAAFADAGAVGCGYCTPAQQLCARALLDAIPDPTEDEIRDALAGCLCRCTGAGARVSAVAAASRARSRS
jgi:aerobic-type carbon monoxide dehydrogenase small subunit (CoxS/CutS family)/CO/xanthine dehydrogenase FAD-binding subunit